MLTTIFSILLQITTPTTTPTDTPVETLPAPAESLSLFDMVTKGGVIMIPIALLGFIATYFFIERWLYLRQVTREKKEFLSSIKQYLKAGDIKGARMYATQDGSATGKIIQVGVEHIGKPMKEIESLMESAANIEVAEMERNMGYLGIIAGVAPMLGFIGTIGGIIRIFYDISQTDNITIGIIAGGLYEKMITSGAGLFVGVISYCAYHILQQRVNVFTLKMQKDVFEFMRSILTPQQ
ncbi:MotA/TolQ/ExbB proton channel family protein [Fulvivirgaceae bacterium PWU5]|uniref:MotA/TolQ/ExbB proton channel family protein n=1 Tax=Dawidia cretensis TaxID=2782350 RepID=A0AAP2DZ27_9BACT|nr:MotA/TolQ/ExbB proton channel family protein [Dawidia cretensis]MBT1710255.1 MotA/TolQ/ExbB proton channel family protein [Dawidia cretensis]